MEDCKVVIRPMMPNPDGGPIIFDPAELAKLSLQARVVLGETPPPSPEPPEPDTGGYDLTNYFYRPDEGRGAYLPNKKLKSLPGDVDIQGSVENGLLIPGETFNVNQRQFRPLGRWYVSRISSGSREGRFVRPKPIVINLGERREYISSLTGAKPIIVMLSGSIMTDNGGPIRFTSLPMRTRMAAAPFTNPHYTDVAHDQIVVGLSGSSVTQEAAGLQVQGAGTPESLLPRVTVGCSVPNIPIDTGGLRKMWLDQQTGLYASGINQIKWVFHGSYGAEMVVDEVYRQVDWTLTPGDEGRPAGTWVRENYDWSAPRRSGDWYEYNPKAYTTLKLYSNGTNLALYSDEIARFGDTRDDYLASVESLLSRGINYFPFSNPSNTKTATEFNLIKADPYIQSADSRPYDAYRAEVDWLDATYAQPEYNRSNIAGGAAALIPGILQQYLEGICTVWNRINRDCNVIRFLNNYGDRGNAFELYFPHMVKFLATSPPPPPTTIGGGGANSGPSGPVFMNGLSISNPTGTNITQPVIPASN